MGHKTVTDLKTNNHKSQENHKTDSPIAALSAVLSGAGIDEYKKQYTFKERVIDEHTILIFDEFIINNNWEQDEYKALNEFCTNNNLSYEVLAVSYFTKQVAVRLIGV